MRKTVTRTVGGAAALAVPMALAFGGVAAADTTTTSAGTSGQVAVQQSGNTATQGSGTVHNENGEWYYHGWKDGQFFQNFNLTAALNLSANGEVYQSGGDWYYHGWKNGEFVSSFNLSAVLNLSSSSSGADSQQQDDGLLGGLLGDELLG